MRGFDFIQALTLAFLAWRTAVLGTRTKQINKAVNNVEPEEPLMVERVRRIEEQIDLVLGALINKKEN